MNQVVFLNKIKNGVYHSFLAAMYSVLVIFKLNLLNFNMMLLLFTIVSNANS